MSPDSDETASANPPGIRVIHADDPERLRQGVSDAFDFRGDVTIRCHDGSEIEGFVFDHHDAVTLESSTLRVLTADGRRHRVRHTDIESIRFTGRDAAAGRSWENWVRRYAEKTLAGEPASIESDPLDQVGTG
jgi:hypothetical protein